MNIHTKRLFDRTCQMADGAADRRTDIDAGTVWHYTFQEYMPGIIIAIPIEIRGHPERIPEFYKQAKRWLDVAAN